MGNRYEYLAALSRFLTLMKQFKRNYHLMSSLGKTAVTGPFKKKKFFVFCFFVFVCAAAQMWTQLVAF